MIPTLTTSGYLHDVNRNRQQYLTKMEKRKAFWMVIVITVCVTIATVIWIVYR